MVLLSHHQKKGEVDEHKLQPCQQTVFSSLIYALSDWEIETNRTLVILFNLSHHQIQQSSQFFCWFDK